MSDKVRLSGIGRVVKEPTKTANGGLMIDIVSNLFDKAAENKEKPMWIRCVLSANSRLFGIFSNFNRPLKGSRVWFEGDFTFNLFPKNDGSTSVGFTIFPTLFEVHTPQPKSDNAAVAGENPPQAPSADDDLPF